MGAVNLDGIQVVQVMAGPTLSGDAAVKHVVAGVEIGHGRASIYDSDASSSAKFAIDVEAGQPWGEIGIGAGSPVTVWGARPVGASGWEFARRFSGIVTDMSGESTPDGVRMNITCQGWSVLAGAVFPPNPWLPPAQRYEYRVQALLDLLTAEGLNVGLALPASGQDGGFYPTLAAVEDDHRQSVLSHLLDVAGQTMSIVCDLPDGTVQFQAQGYRQSRPIIDVPGSAIEWRVSMSQEFDVVNRVTAHWAGGSYTVDETLSQDVFGVWADEVNCAYTEQPQVTRYGTRIVRRQSFPSWQAPSVRIRLGELDRATLRAVLGLKISDRVRLPPVPAPYPSTAQVWVVEGWTEHTGRTSETDTEWTLDLSLSPPRLSVMSARWVDMSGTWTQQTGTWDLWGTQ